MKEIVNIDELHGMIEAYLNSISIINQYINYDMNKAVEIILDLVRENEKKVKKALEDWNIDYDKGNTF